MAPTLTPGSSAASADATSPIVVRPLDPTDTDALSALDTAHAAEHGVRTVVSRASVHYFLRSGHSFVAELAPTSVPVGLILAHPVWGGADAVVRVERLSAFASSGRVAEVASALTAAVVKSAYDAGVYRLVAAVPVSDDVSIGALTAAKFGREASVVFELSLGSGVLSGSKAVEINELADDRTRRSA